VLGVVLVTVRYSNDKDVMNGTYSRSLALFSCVDGSNTVRLWDYDTCFVELQFRMESVRVFINEV
jgi:hypothetical protein